MGIKNVLFGGATIVGVVIVSALLAIGRDGYSTHTAEEKSSSSVITHVCDERGVCCYERSASHEFSCVATTIKVVVLPGDVQNWESQGDKPIEGEVGSRALEERLFKEHRGAFVLQH